MDIYLRSTYFIDTDNPIIKQMAMDVISGVTTQMEKALRLFYAVRDGITYNPFVDAYIRENNVASWVVKRGEGYCVQKAIVLIALARSVGIPSRLGLADIINHALDGPLLDAMGTNIFTCHGYVEFYLGDRWIKATPAFDIGMCRRKQVPPVDFDGMNDALLPPEDNHGRRYIEYVRYHGSFDDMPFDFIMDKWKEYYPRFSEIINQSQ